VSELATGFLSIRSQKSPVGKQASITDYGVRTEWRKAKAVFYYGRIARVEEAISFGHTH
jgi:hypothetical protein